MVKTIQGQEVGTQVYGHALTFIPHGGGSYIVTGGH